MNGECCRVRSASKPSMRRDACATACSTPTMPRAVRDRLRADGLTPTAVDAAPERGSPLQRTRLPAPALALLTRQLASLVQSGMPLDQALLAVSEQAGTVRSSSTRSTPAPGGWGCSARASRRRTASRTGATHSCAGDLAAIARAVLRVPRLARIVRRREAVLPFPRSRAASSTSTTPTRCGRG